MSSRVRPRIGAKKAVCRMRRTRSKRGSALSTKATAARRVIRSAILAIRRSAFVF